MSIQVVVQCVARDADGSRCQRHTRKTNYCTQHLRSELGLEVRPSQIPGAGDGLFTTIARRHGNDICEYGGRITLVLPDEDDDPEGVYFTGPYVLQLKRGVYINAARTDSVGRYINCARNVRNRAGELVPQVNDWNEPLLTNCQFVPNFRARPQKAMVRATKYIPADSELFIAYGRGYSLPTGVLRIPKHDPREAPRKPAMPAKPAKGTKNNPIVL